MIPGSVWVLEKGVDVVRCRVDDAVSQRVICIEVISRPWPLSLVQRCDEDGVSEAVERWRALFRERGWTEPGDGLGAYQADND